VPRCGTGSVSDGPPPAAEHLRGVLREEAVVPLPVCLRSWRDPPADQAKTGYPAAHTWAVGNRPAGATTASRPLRSRVIRPNQVSEITSVLLSIMSAAHQ
jgi:hypothetical protein